MLTLRIKSRRSELREDEIDFLISARRVSPPPPMARAASFLTPEQWSAACALKEISPFEALADSLESDADLWREWIDSATPELEELPGEWSRPPPLTPSCLR